MLKKSYIFFSLWALTSFQGKELKLKSSIQGSFEQMCVGNSGIIYALNGAILSKYDINGNVIRTYSSKLSGGISSIDVKGDHRILLFFQSSGQIIFLDNTLSPLNKPLSLVELGYEDVRTACLSGKEGFWIYDGTKDAVFHLGWDGKKLNESPVLASWRKESMPFHMKERDNQLLLCFKEGGLLFLDQFASPGKMIPAKGSRAEEMTAETLYLLNGTGDSLHWRNFKTLEEGAFLLPVDSCLDFQFSNQSLYLLEPKRISIFDEK